MIIKSENRDKKKRCNRCNQVQNAIGDRYPPLQHMQQKSLNQQVDILNRAAILIEQ